MMEQVKPLAVIGTNSWGSAAYEKLIRGSAVDVATLKQAMEIAEEMELFVVDSARDYGFGKGPKLIGECCSAKMVISSKFTPVGKYRAGQVRESVVRDLQDFGREYIEIFWLHLPNNIPEYLAEIIELYHEGKVKNIGVSNFNLEECKKAQAILAAAGIPLYGVQNHYSLIDREWEKNGLIKWCHDNGVQFWAWAVLEEGVLTGPKTKEENFSLMKALFSRKRRKLQQLFVLMQQIGEQHGLTVAQVAMAFVANKGLVPVCGCRKPYQVAQLQAACVQKLTVEEMTALQNSADSYHMKILGADLFRFAVKQNEPTNKGFWQRFAFIYSRFMKKNDKAYEKIVSMVKKYISKQSSVLELACGTGQLSFPLAGHAQKWTATDFASGMVEQARKRNRAENLQFAVADATNLPYGDKSFDIVVIANALHIVPEPEAVMGEIKRVLKSGGILIAPTFVYDEQPPRLKMKLLETAGFKIFHKWSAEEYVAFIEGYNFQTVQYGLISGNPLAECVYIGRNS